MSDPQAHENQSYKPPKRHWKAAESFWHLRLHNVIEILFAALLVGIGGLQAYIYWRQSLIMASQARIMATQTAILDDANKLNAAIQRPLILVDLGMTEQQEMSVNTWRFWPIIKNIGATAGKADISFLNPDQNISIMLDDAREGGYNVETRLSVMRQIGAPADPDIMFTEKPSNPIRSLVTYGTSHIKITIGPKSEEPFRGPFGGARIDLMHIAMVAGYAKSTYLYGLIRYQDTFNDGRTYETKFCFNLASGRSLGPGGERPIAARCTHWNCTDDDQCKADKNAYENEVSALSKAHGTSSAP